MMNRLTTTDIRNILKEKYENNEFRIIGNNVKTIEIQNANFIADAPYIIREPNYEYIKREIEWYKSMSLNVDDIPGETPTIWKQVASKDGLINSNYGWCIFSEENGYQYRNVLRTLIADNNSRQAIMIYNRPSMHMDAFKDGMHDFMCCQNVQYFLNDTDDKNVKRLDAIVNFRSNDAVFGYNNDYAWNLFVLTNLAQSLTVNGVETVPGNIYWNAMSLHVYERHFKFL